MDFETARRNMVDSQLRTNKITDPRILAAMGGLPREAFLPESKRGIAYIDEDIEFGNGRFLMEPAVIGRLMQEISPEPDDVGLVVGCGTGYSAAVLAKLVDAVFALESDAALAAQASKLFTELSLDNIVVVEGPLADGWPDQGPYDVILVDGAVSEMPQALIRQLAEGGRLAGIVKSERAVGRATLFGKRGGAVSGRTLFDAAVPFIPELRSRPEFVF
jgi:protein-L-isoaspartate(D-aspartate) O-methyltransferase